MTLHILGSEIGSEGARSPASTPGARHSFTPYANPERNKSCARCGRPESHEVHVDLLEAPIVRAASAICDLQIAAKYGEEGEWRLARENALRAVRVIDGLIGEA